MKRYQKDNYQLLDNIELFQQQHIPFPNMEEIRIIFDNYQILKQQYSEKNIEYEDVMVLSFIFTNLQQNGTKQINTKTIIQHLEKYNIESISVNIITQQSFLLAMKTFLSINATLNLFDIKIATFNKYEFQLFINFLSESINDLQYYSEFEQIVLSLNKINDDNLFIMIVFMTCKNFNTKYDQIVSRLSFINPEVTISVLQSNIHIIEKKQNNMLIPKQQESPYPNINRIFQQLCIYYSFNIIMYDGQQNQLINIINKQHQMYFNQDLLNLLNFLAYYFNLNSNILNLKQYLDNQAEIYFMQNFDPKSLYITDYASKQMIQRAEEVIAKSKEYKRERMILSLYDYKSILSMAIKQRILRFNPLVIDTTEFSVNRNQISTDILSQFYQYKNDLQNQRIIEYQHNKLQKCQLITHQHIYIAFKYEDGVDAGGLSKEVFNVLVDNLVTEDYWLFRQIGSEEKHFYWPDQTSQNDPQNLEQDFTFLGVVFGICLLNGFLIDDYFPDLFYYLLIYEDITLDTLIELVKEIDQEFVDNLLKLKEYQNIPDLEDIIQQTFSFTINQYDYDHLIELKENGRNICLTNQNIDEYIELRLYKTFYNTFHQQMFKYMRQGLRLVIFQFKLDFFTPQEIRLALCGDNINLYQLQQIAVYEAPYHENHKIILWFWEVLNEFDHNYKKMFLKFMFSTPRMDPIGFQKFEIQRNGDNNGYPVAHTCNSTLDLPEYLSKEILKERLSFSVQFCEGFGII